MAVDAQVMALRLASPGERHAGVLAHLTIQCQTWRVEGCTLVRTDDGATILPPKCKNSEHRIVLLDGIEMDSALRDARIQYAAKLDAERARRQPPQAEAHP